MEKYNGNQKGFIYVSCDVKDQEEVLEKYLEPLAQDGISFWWADGFGSKEEKILTRSSAVLLFLTKDFAKGKKLKATLAAAVKHNKAVLCVYLEDVELDAVLSMQTEAQQALYVSKYKSDDEFVAELKKAAIFNNIRVSEQQKKQQKSRALAAVAAVVIVLIAAVIIIKPLLSTKANAETMEALGLTGLSRQELESIEALMIVGDEIKVSMIHAFYIGGDHGTVYYHNGGDIKGNYHQYYVEPGDEASTAVGNISDLAGVEQLKNLRLLELEGQQIEDITPLLGLENLEQLSLNCNPLRSLEGIENLSNLKKLDISGTDVSDLTPVLKLENLEQLIIDDTDINDLSGIENMKNLKFISIRDTGITTVPDGTSLVFVDASGSALASVPDFGGRQDVDFYTESAESLSDYSKLSTAGSYRELRIDNQDASAWLSYLKGVPINGNLFTQDLEIENMHDLDGLVLKGKLDLNDSTIRSLDGIDGFELTSILIKHCENLTDLSPINGTGITHIQISDDMEELAEGLDDSINVEVE